MIGVDGFDDRSAYDAEVPMTGPDVGEMARLREIEAAARAWLAVPRRERYTDQLDAALARLTNALTATPHPAAPAVRDARVSHAQRGPDGTWTSTIPTRRTPTRETS